MGGGEHEEEGHNTRVNKEMIEWLIFYGRVFYGTSRRDEEAEGKRAERRKRNKEKK